MWALCVVFQFDVVCHNDMCEHGFQLACGKETSGAINSQIFDGP